MMDLGSITHVKAVLIVGNYNNKAQTYDWILKVGNYLDPISNTQIYPLLGTSVEWAKEVKVDAWGQKVAIIRTTNSDFLSLGYVAVFATSFDCSIINTFTVASLPQTISIG